MIERSDLPAHTTGSPALDRVLGGGVPSASTTIVAGLPGTGKTTLAEQILFANASEHLPALYLTTLSEPLAKTVRYLQRYAFFDPSMVPGVIHYQDIGEAIRTRGIAVLPELVEDLVIERGASLLVIDSFKALHDLAPDPSAFRAALFDLGRVLTASGVTAMLLGEYNAAEIASLPEFAVADAVVELSNRSHGVRDERVIRVHKLRGAAYLPGEHTFRITEGGIEVFPRLVGAEVAQAGFAEEQVPTGVPGLDELMDGGPWRGGATLVAGPTGIGKTMLGLRFLLTGIEAGEPGLLVSFQESPRRLARLLRGFGADLEDLERRGLLRVVYLAPLEIDLVELFGHVTEVMRQGHARRLVIDALNDMEEAAVDRGRFRATLWSYWQYLGLHGATGLFLVETPLEHQTLLPTGSAGVSYMADALILLRYLEDPSGPTDRVLRVLKTRGSEHDPRPHAFQMTAAGPLISPGPH